MSNRFSMLDEKFYLTQVEKTMDKLRAACLGQDIDLSSVLPQHFKNRSPEEQAKQLAEQITFVLVAAADYANKSLDQLPECRGWLYNVTLYLLQQCNEEDQTFAQMKKLIFLPQSIRRIMFLTFLEGSCKELLQDDPPPLLKEEFDIAILALLNAHGLFSRAKNMHASLGAFFEPDSKCVAT